MQASKTTNSAQTQRRYGPGGDSAIGTHNGRMVARLQRDISFHSFTSPGLGLDLLGEQHSFTYLENNIPSPTWRTTFLHLLGEQHSFTSPGGGLDLHLDLAWTYLENNIPSPHLGLAWTGPRPRPRPRPRTGPGPTPGPGLHMDLDYTWTWTWTWTSPGHQRFLQIRCLLRFLLQLHLLHLDLLLLSLPRPVIKLVQLQVSWPSEREQRGPILTQPRHLGSRDPSKFRFLLVLQIPLGSAGPRITRATRLPGHPSSPGPAATCLPPWRGRRFTRPTVSPGSEDQYSLHPGCRATWTPGTQRLL